MGAIQKSQRCDRAQPSTNTAGPVLQTGFTDEVKLCMTNDVHAMHAIPPLLLPRPPERLLVTMCWAILRPLCNLPSDRVAMIRRVQDAQGPRPSRGARATLVTVG